jgi:hypothetical protein
MLFKHVQKQSNDLNKQEEENFSFVGKKMLTGEAKPELMNDVR